MTHRLDVHSEGRTAVLEFQGLLDEHALAGLRVMVAQVLASGARARVVLRERAEVERCCVAALRSLGAEIVAEPAYLAAWLRETK